MKLSGLVGLIENSSSFQSLIYHLESDVYDGRKVIAYDAARPYIIACLYHKLGCPALVVTSKSERARKIHDEIRVWVDNEEEIWLLPEPDALPYERLSSDTYTVQQRLRTISNLTKSGHNPLIVSSVHAASWKTIPFKHFIASMHTLKKGVKVDLHELFTRWLDLGYVVENRVELPGTMCRRGGIIDIYSPHSDLPARIELFGDVIDSIRLFEPATQHSTETISEIQIIPAREMIANSSELASAINRLELSKLTPEAREAIECDVLNLTDGRLPDVIDFYSAVVNKGTLFDYLPENTVIILDEVDDIETTLNDLHSQATEIREAQIERNVLPHDFPVPYLSWAELKDRMSEFNRLVEVRQWGDDSKNFVMEFAATPSYAGHLTDFFKEIKRIVNGHRRLFIVSQRANRLSELLSEQDIIISPVNKVEQLPPPGSLTLVYGSVGEGWAFAGESGDVLFTDTEIFSYVKEQRSTAKRAVHSEEFLSEIVSGDYVVHIDHGIGKFLGLIKKNVESGEREYLVLEYASGDKLYVPSDQLDRVSRYIGSGGYSPALSRLGTLEWGRAKKRVKEATQELAKNLLALYSAREVSRGISFTPDTPWQHELEASFPYVETRDQLKAVRDVKLDMEMPRPMDRLVCGDVGYGKTEVALRAAFKAVMSGMQVAILVPTTVLAQQHFATFSERLNPFPFKVELLSRFRSVKNQQGVVEGLVNGAVDICIGTHRLLQKDIVFKNLGLVIIDEEQRFGVAHKEKLKQLREEVDVLTLSATPIPRTLHMAMIGVRDMSNMETPPEERLPIKTLVGAYNERLVREAILRELERGGQVFYVHNRVRKIVLVAKTLEQLVPEARISIGHGQMPEEHLEKVMFDFARGKVDVLVCTTIIESGLDLPNVNTLIIEDADKLGLTQLYQLRGRVGRGANRAYAYFLYEKGKKLTDTARKRLKTIYEATELGSGFRIAIKDLEIRGAGNLLGPEQSGNMGAVGFDLYCRLLAEAVDELKPISGVCKKREIVSTAVDLPLAAVIPDGYVSDLSTRLALYMKLAKLETLEDLNNLAIEFQDRFGPLPLEVKNLLYMVKIKLMGSAAGVPEIVVQNGQVIIKLGESTKLDKDLMMAFYGNIVKIGPTQIRMDISKAGKSWQKKLEEVLSRVSH